MSDDDAKLIKMYLDGMRKHPRVDGIPEFPHDLKYDPQWREHMTELQRAAHEVTSKINADCEDEPITLALRIKTHDDMVEVVESRVDGASIKLYGPFATADEQRAFMLGLVDAMPESAERDRIRASVVAWRRFDEEDAK